MNTDTVKKLRRSSTDRVVAGVVGGMSKYLGIDPLVGRIIYIGLSVASIGFPGTIVYIACAIFIPVED